MRLASLILGIFVLALIAGCDASDDIRIGYVGPLTGDAVSYGVDTLHGVELAVRELNARRGIDGKNIRLIVEDGRCTATDASNAAHKLIEADHVVAILGGNCSTETLAIAPVAEAAQVVVLSPISSSAKVTEAGDYIFRVYPSGVFTGPMYGKYFAEQGATKIAMISEDTDYARGLQAAISENLTGSARAVFNEVVEPGSKDFRALLTRLKDTDFDVLSLQLQSDAAVGALMKQYAELELTKPVFGGDVAESNTLAASPEMEGMYIVAIASPDPGRAQAVDFMKAYRAAYGEPRQNFFYPALAYDAANILFQTIGSTGTGTALRDGLYDAEYAGVMGDLSFDENGDVRGVPYGFKKWQNGGVHQITSVLPQ